MRYRMNFKAHLCGIQKKIKHHQNPKHNHFKFWYSCCLVQETFCHKYLRSRYWNVHFSHTLFYIFTTHFSLIGKRLTISSCFTSDRTKWRKFWRAQIHRETPVSAYSSAGQSAWSPAAVQATAADPQQHTVDKLLYLPALLCTYSLYVVYKNIVLYVSKSIPPPFHTLQTFILK